MADTTLTGPALEALGDAMIPERGRRKLAPDSYVLGALTPDRFYEALGLGDRKNISELTLTIRMSEAVVVRFKELVLRKGFAVVEQESAQIATLGQVEALTDVIEDVTTRGDGGWHASQRGEPALREGSLCLDGPMERLARAVLAGDVKSALVLADRVQEVWGAAQDVHLKDKKEV